MSKPSLLHQDRSIAVDGQFVSQRVSRIVEAIKDYEPELDVRWVPPEARQNGEAAFAIFHCPVGYPEYVLMYVQHEDDMTEQVLAKIIYNDQRNGEHTYTELEAAETTAKLVARQKELDDLEEARDIAAFVARTHLNKIRINKDLTIYDDGDLVSKIRP